MLSRYATKVRKLLRTIYPKPQPIKKEVSLGEFTEGIRLSKHVQDMIKLYDAHLGRMRVDFWVQDQVVIEVHGEQHEHEIRFSNDIEDTEAELIRRKGLDLIKQEALKESGVPIVIVWYYEIEALTTEQLKDKIMAAQTIAQKTIPNKIPEKSRQASRLNHSGERRILHTRSSLSPTSRMDYKRRGSRLENNRLSRGRFKGSPLVSRPLQKPKPGESKLSKDWKRFKEEE